MRVKTVFRSVRAKDSLIWRRELWLVIRSQKPVAAMMRVKGSSVPMRSPSSSSNRSEIGSLLPTQHVCSHGQYQEEAHAQQGAVSSRIYDYAP
jgi:hypothetical protein